MDNNFLLEFSDAAQLLQQWRNPHLGRSSREGTILALFGKTRFAIDNTKAMLLSNQMDSEIEEELINQLKVNSFLLNYTLPEALELVNQDVLLTEADILKFIEKHLALMKEELGSILPQAESIMNQLQNITDLEVRDQFGRKKRVQRSDVLEILGRVLGSLIVRQVSLRPVDNMNAKPRGRLKLKETYKAAIMRTTKVPPTEIIDKDIRVVDKDRLSLIYFVLDTSQSMGKIAFGTGITRLDGALLTGLGLYYYFNLTNRRKRREFDSFKLHLVPVVDVPYVIDEQQKLEDFLFSAESKGKTRLVHSVQSIVRHVNEHQKDNDYDVQIIMLTDGRPNVPYLGHLPGRRDNKLEKLFKESSSKTKDDTHECMIQLNQLFTHLKYTKDRAWNISYFLMAKDSFQNSDLFKDTKMMLRGIASPINIDPTEIDKLGAKIIREAMS